MILVTGGTGLVGIHLLIELSTLPDAKIIAIYRTEASLQHACNVFLQTNTQQQWDAIIWIKADITDIPSLEEVFSYAQINQVYHCAGYITFQSNAFEKLKKINIEGTANMINLSIDYKVQKFCHVSSIATLNLNAGQNIIDETSQWNSEQDNSGYAITKFGAEMEVWRGSEEGLSVIIVHPGVIIGKGFTTGSSEIFIKVKKGLPFYTEGSSGYVSARDVARSMIALMKSNIKNENYVLVAANKKHKQVIDIIAEVFSKRKPTIQVSKFVTKLFAAVESVLSIVLRSTPTITKDMVNSLFSSTPYSGKKIKQHINFEFEPIENVIEQVAETFKH